MAGNKTEEIETEQALIAMLAIIMAANPATTDYAAGIEMVDASGAVVTGQAAAHAILMSALKHNQAAWAEWLVVPENANEAVSLAVALSPEMRTELGENSEVLSALDKIRRPIVRYAPRAVDVRDVIDIRDGSSISK